MNKRDLDDYSLPDIGDRMCCGKAVIVAEATGDWACWNPKCKYYHGAQIVLEKEYKEWYKNQKSIMMQSFWS